jgi:hypothetical protein
MIDRADIVELGNPIQDARELVREGLCQRSLAELRLARARLERRTEFGDWEEIAAHMGAVLAIVDELAERSET